MILEAKNLCKTFRFPEMNQILSNVSLNVEKGESIAITGRSGEGKTTLLHILGTLEPFDSGEVIIAGEKFSIQNASRLRNEHIGFVFQSFNLLEDFTVLDNVLMPARIARKPLNRKHGLELLKLVGLESRASFPAKLLSGGERQRAAIARSLCNNPDIIFADEPSGNLDRTNAESIGNLLFDLVKSHNKTLILVTHDASLASRCTHRFELSRGKLSL